MNKILSQYEGCSAIQANELVLTRCGDETLVKMPSKDSAESAPVLFGVSKLFNDKLSFMLTAPSSSSSSSSSSAAGTGTAPKAATGPTYPVKLETMAPFNSARNEDHTSEKFIESVNNLLDARGVPKSQQAVSGMALSIKEGKGYAWVNFPTQAASEVAVANLDKSELWMGSGIYVSAKAKAPKALKTFFEWNHAKIISMQKFKPVYCKHFPKEWTEADLTRKMIDLGASQEEIHSVRFSAVSNARSGKFAVN